MAVIILAAVASGAVGMPVAEGKWTAPVGLSDETENSKRSVPIVGPKMDAVVIGQHGEIKKQAIVELELDAKKGIIRSVRSGAAELEASAAVSMPVSKGHWTASVGLDGEAQKLTPSIRSVGTKRAAMVIDQHGGIQKQVLGQHGEIERKAIAERELDAKKGIIRSVRPGVAESEASAAASMPIAKGHWTASVGLHGEAEKLTPSIRSVGTDRGAVVIDQHGEIQRQTVVEPNVEKTVKEVESTSARNVVLCVLGGVIVFVACYGALFYYLWGQYSGAGAVSERAPMYATDQYGTEIFTD